MTESSARSAAHTTMTQRGLIGAVLLAFFLSGGMAFSASNDETNPPSFQMPKTGIKSGHITAKHETSVGISGTDYAFHPKIEFWTDEGQQLEWKEFKRGDEVQFHLKQGKVDYLILIPPK
ncbi:MAG: hypothetical protein HY444_01625 [Nitrospirae bacterium]|nr:hypothetical protein [Nitrospirota bacterium]